MERNFYFRSCVAWTEGGKLFVRYGIPPQINAIDADDVVRPIVPGKRAAVELKLEGPSGAPELPGLPAGPLEYEPALTFVFCNSSKARLTSDNWLHVVIDCAGVGVYDPEGVFSQNDLAILEQAVSIHLDLGLGLQSDGGPHPPPKPK